MPAQAQRAPIEERMAHAKSILALAERGSGVRAVSSISAPMREAPDSPEPSNFRRSTAVPAAGHREDRVALGVLEPLWEVLPQGLVRGGVTVVHGSTFTALSTLVKASEDGAWIAVVGAPELNYAAVHDVGISLERVVAIPDADGREAQVIAALLDGVDIVFVGGRCGLTDGEKRTLLARARERGAVIVSQQEWRGARAVLSGEGASWVGLAGIGMEGLGRLRERTYTLRRRDPAGGGRRCEFTGKDGLVHGPVSYPRAHLRVAHSA